jgi:hypothetical protein
MAISNPGPGHSGTAGSLNSVPASQKALLATNYIDFTADGNDWGQQYVPDLMEKEAEVFGNRTISGFLAQVGAEEAMSSDQVIWSEQGRLHLSYVGKYDTNENTFTVVQDIDGNSMTTKHGIRINDMVVVATAEGTIKCFVSAVAGAVATCLPYEVETVDAATAFSDTGVPSASNATLLVVGSEFGKGAQGQGATTATVNNGYGAVKPTHTSFTNKPIIMKDYYEISGSDASQIGWVEVTGEDMGSGYLWYLKAEGDTRARFSDYVEMSMLEAVKGVESASTADGSINGTANTFGTEGLFAAVETRGNVTTGVTGVNAATDLAEFDAILAEFDSQGAIEENMMFVNRGTSLAIDDMLASMNSYGAGGTSYGVFDNSEDMALNLGFSGFRRGSYDFYKSDFRYLNDKATRGSINAAATGGEAVRGVVVPAGVSNVYDQQLGKNLKRPFLHVRYRASQTESRKMKTWTTGSVGATTSDLDAMQINYLTERCLITQGANNFMLMK